MSANQHIDPASRGACDWSTPQDFFDKLNKEFGFTCDAAADHENHKCSYYFTKEDDGLFQDWVETVWCNPPYGRAIGKWVKKGYESSLNGATVVMLVPASTDVAWFHDYAMKGELRFVRKRLKFGGSKVNAPFGSVVVIFRPSFTDRLAQAYVNDYESHHGKAGEA